MKTQKLNADKSESSKKELRNVKPRLSRRIDVADYRYTDQELKDARTSVDRVLAKALKVTSNKIAQVAEEEKKASEKVQPKRESQKSGLSSLVRDSTTSLKANIF